MCQDRQPLHLNFLTTFKKTSHMYNLAWVIFLEALSVSLQICLWEQNLENLWHFWHLLHLTKYKSSPRSVFWNFPVNRLPFLKKKNMEREFFSNSLLTHKLEQITRLHWGPIDDKRSCIEPVVPFVCEDVVRPGTQSPKRNLNCFPHSWIDSWATGLMSELSFPAASWLH